MLQNLLLPPAVGRRVVENTVMPLLHKLHCDDRYLTILLFIYLMRFTRAIQKKFPCTK